MENYLLTYAQNKIVLTKMVQDVLHKCPKFVALSQRPEFYTVESVRTMSVREE
jgi:hypothetical protein